MSLPETLSAQFTHQFGEPPTLVKSPGRVNLIGEHTDYNEGFVLPAAVDKAIYLAVGPRSDRQLHFTAADLNSTYTGSLDKVERATKSWANYLLGVIEQVQREHQLPGGLNVVFGGDIPIGSGMSSSAALENAVVFALNHLYGLGMERIAMVRLSQRAENEFVGAKVGIMDMFASMMGRAGHVIKLDCRSLDYTYAPFQMAGIRIVLCDSRVKHSLVTSEYNTRRAECEQGVALVRAGLGDDHIRSLRDVTMEMLDTYLREQNPHLYRRCAYVVQENQRLLDGVADLERGDLAAFGQRMYGSHEGLSHWYEVSCPELDILVDIARAHPGVLGARMMGGGFGGCTINLVAPAHADEFVKQVGAAYQRRFGRVPETYQTSIVGGVSVG